MPSDLKAEILSDVRELAALDAVSGFEDCMIAEMMRRLSPLSDSCQVDTWGNVHATLEGHGDGYHLLLAAHADEIGLLVKSIEADGFLRFDVLAGAQPALLPGRLVRLNGTVTGVIGVKAGHLQTAEERSRLPRPDELYIDVGARSAAEVAALGIQVGDPVAFYSPLVQLGHPDVWAGKAVDDRLGCAVLLALLRRLRSVEHRTCITVAITTQEEVGARGAAIAARVASPDCAVAIDTVPVGDTPDISFERELPIAIGRGPVLLVANSTGPLGNIAHPAMRRLLERAAGKAGIPFQRAIILASGAFTDAAAIQRAERGIPSGGISLPRRYSHSPVCTFDLNDAAAAVLWLEALVGLLDEKPSLAFLQS